MPCLSVNAANYTPGRKSKSSLSIRAIRTHTSPSPVKAHSKSKEKGFLVSNRIQKGNHGENRMRFSPQWPIFVLPLVCRRPAEARGHRRFVVLALDHELRAALVEAEDFVVEV